MTNQTPSLQCPRCNQIDAVYKVSALYEHGFSTETYQRLIPPPPKTNWAPLMKTEERTVQSNLSKKLSPPSKPRPTDIRGPLIILVLIIGVPLLCSTLGSSGSLLQSPAFIVFIVFGVLLNVFAASYKKNEEARVANLMPGWTKAMGRWNQLYYCARDDVVFHPDDGSFVSASEMSQYLYR